MSSLDDKRKQSAGRARLAQPKTQGLPPFAKANYWPTSVILRRANACIVPPTQSVVFSLIPRGLEWTLGALQVEA
jgi:hypothetical protein